MKKKILKEGSKDGRPRIGKEARKNYTVKVEPKIKEAIVAEYGGLTYFINMKIDEDKKLSKRLGTK